MFHAQRVTDLATAARAVADGHVDMVAMTRAHIADPHLVKKLSEGRADDIRQCVGAGYCIDRIYCRGRRALHPERGDRAGGDDAARDPPRRTSSVACRRDRRRARADLEAARVAAERGTMRSCCSRRTRRLAGGQIGIASKAGWREALSGIPRWLVRPGHEARRRSSGSGRKRPRPSIHGGEARRRHRCDGRHAPRAATPKARTRMPSRHGTCLTGAVEPTGSVLLYDEMGQHNAVIDGGRFSPSVVASSRSRRMIVWWRKRSARRTSRFICASSTSSAS